MKLRRNRSGQAHIIPGFGISMGITIAMLSLLILIPLSAILVKAFSGSPAEFFAVLTQKNVIGAFKTSILCALIAAAVNVLAGLMLAWVLSRISFPGKRLVDGLIELPFAMPTAVAGITLSLMYSDQGIMGKFLGIFGIPGSYTRVGLTIALVFVGIPFVVRSVQPVLLGLDSESEEAAHMLGATRRITFLKVILPELTPALLSGFSLAFARGIGEYGSVIYISGNSAKKGTQVVSYVIMQKLNSGNIDYRGAATVALLLLIISFAVLLAINLLQMQAARRADL